MVERFSFGDDVSQLDAELQQESLCLHDTLVDVGYQLLDVLGRIFCVIIRRGIVRQSLLHVLEHIHVIHDDATRLARIYSVGTSDGLHQRMPLHRFVEIERGERWHVKTREPHGTDEDQAQRVILILEAVFDVLAIRCYRLHLLAMPRDVKTLGGKLLLLAIFLTNHHCHLYLIHIVETFGQSDTLIMRLCLIALFDELLLLLSPVFLYLVIHSHGSVFIHTHHHALAQESSSWEMMGDVLGYAVQSAISLDYLQDARGRVLQEFFFSVVEILIFHNLVDVGI